MKPTKLQAPAVCPVCGEDVPRGSLACPECGADHNSGWREDVDSCDGVDLPDEDFDYDQFVREEFGTAWKPAGIGIVWWIAAVVLIVAMMIVYFHTSH